jgi:hypothetical protein
LDAHTQADVARVEEGQRQLAAALQNKAETLQVARALERKADKAAAMDDRRELLGALTTKAAASDVAGLMEVVEAMRKEMLVRGLGWDRVGWGCVWAGMIWVIMVW